MSSPDSLPPVPARFPQADTNSHGAPDRDSLELSSGIPTEPAQGETGEIRSSRGHRIRLRGPWRLEPLARTRRMADGTSHVMSELVPPAGKTTSPSDWGSLLGPDFRGRVRYTRQFNRPSGMEQVERIDLVIGAVDAFGCVVLNGQLLGEIPPGSGEFRTEITSHLQLFNRLEVEVELPECVPSSLPLPRGARDSLPGGLVGEVYLEIRGG
jgi:hypothetical protein